MQNALKSPKTSLNGGIMDKIVLTLDSAQLGGIETHVLTLATDLVKRGYELEVLFIKAYPGNCLYQALSDNGIDYSFAGSVKGYWQALRQQRNNSILHTHGYKAGILGRVFSKLLGIRVISTYHSGDLGSGKLRFYSYLDQMTAGLAQCIAVSEPIKARLPATTEMIPNFVEVKAHSEDESEDEAEQNRQDTLHTTPSTKPLQVAFVGRLSVEKGPDRFCQLAAMWFSDKSTDDNRALEFVMYGDGPEREQLTTSFDPLVKFKGHVDMKEHWCDVDVLCISSRYEGLPYVALEAMARGIPVVSFDIGGIGDLICDPSLGWLAKPDDINSLKQALHDWYTLSAVDRGLLAKNVRQKIYQDYSTAALVPGIEAKYRLQSA
ncbi:MAG: glycosyltransferase involved in cell wall biosynthesis [Phenylobacterium sp.]